MDDWHVLDAELHEQGWSMQVLHSHGEWHVFMGNVAYLPAAGKANTLQEAVGIAYTKIKER